MLIDPLERFARMQARTDPANLLPSILRRAGISAATNGDEPQLPELSPEQQDSLLSQVVGGALGGLQYVGETLDKPGAAIRGLLGGQPEQLLNLIPFSDAMGLTDPKTRVSGRDLLERAGLLEKNTPGLDLGDVAGFGTEVLLDPMNLVSFGGPATLTAAGRELAQFGGKAAELAGENIPKILGHAASPAAKIAEISGRAEVMGKPLSELAGAGLRAAAEKAGGPAPLRGALSFGLEGSLPGWIAKKAGLGDVPFVGKNIVPEWATGDLPAAALSSLYYGKFSPVRPIRGLFSNMTGEQTQGMAQMVFDMGRAEQIHARAAAVEKAAALRGKVGGLMETFQEMTKASNPEDVPKLENLIRSTVETPDFNAQTIADNLQKLANHGMYPEFAKQFEDVVGHLASLPATVAAQLRSMGLPLAMLDDAFVAYSPRRFNQELIAGTKEAFGKATREYNEAKNALLAAGIHPGDVESVSTLGKDWSAVKGLDAVAEKLGMEPADLFDRIALGPPARADFAGQRFLVTHPWFSEARNKIWKDVPGGTTMNNVLSSIGWIVGRAHGSEIQDAMFKEFSEAVPWVNGSRLSPGAFHAELQKIMQQHGLNWDQAQEALKETWDLAKERHAHVSELYQQARKAAAMSPRELQLLASKGATPEQLASLDLVGQHLAGIVDKNGQRFYEGLIDPANAGQDLLNMLKQGAPSRLYRNHAETLNELRSALTNGNYVRPLHMPTDVVKWGDLTFDKAGIERIAADMNMSKLADKLFADLKAGNPQGLVMPQTAAAHALQRPAQYSQEIAAAYISKRAGIHIDKAMEMVQRLEKMDPAVLGVGRNLSEFDTLDEATKYAKLFYNQHGGQREFAVVPNGKRFAVMSPDGMFNRGTAEDVIDYLEHSARVHWGLNSVHRVLSDPKIAVQQADLVDNNLGEAWKKMGLTNDGLITLLQGRGLNPADAEDALNMAGSIEVPPEVTAGVTKFMRAHTQPETMKGLLGFVDKWLATFKGGVTMPFAAFHVRNFISGQYANWQMGQWSLRSHKWAQALAAGKDIDMGEAGKLTAADLARELKDYGVIENTALHDIQHGSVTASPPSIIGALKQSFLTPEGKLTVGSAAKALNPLQLRGGFDLEGAVLRGGSVKERLGRLMSDTAEDSSLFAIKGGEAAYKKVEYYNRVPAYLELRAQGLTAAEAAERIKMSQFDYSDLTHFERTVMKRVVPFYCVPEHSEALTRDGWKHYTQIEFGEELLTYNLERDRYEWQPCLEVAAFQHDQELMQWSNKIHSLQFTPNHRWVADMPAMTVKRPYGTYNYPAKRSVVDGEDLTKMHSIVVVSQYHGEQSILTPTQARLLGWLVTDGYWRERGSHMEAMIYQHPKKFLAEVLEVAGGNPRKQHPDTGVVCVPVLKERVNEVREYLDKDKLPSIVTRLSREALEAFYDAAYKGDGTVSENRTSDFLAAKHPGVREAIQIACTLLGKRCVTTHRGAVISHRQKMRLGMGQFEKKHYRGVVWCPRTENGTWVMRQGKLVTITGNTYSRMNLPFQLKMLLDNPGGRTAQTVRAFNAARDETKDTGFVPRYLAESLAIPLGGTPESRKYLSISGTLPIEEALNHFAFTNNLPDLRRTAQKFGGMLNFMIQQPIESVTDTQLWSGRRKSHLYQEPTFWPAVNAMLYGGAVPYAPRLLSTARPFFDPRKDWWQGPASALIGGVKVTDVSPQAKLLEARDILDRSMPQERGVGEFHRLYASDVGKMNSDTATKMALYNALTQSLSKASKERKKKAGD